MRRRDAEEGGVVSIFLLRYVQDQWLMGIDTEDDKMSVYSSTSSIASSTRSRRKHSSENENINVNLRGKNSIDGSYSFAEEEAAYYNIGANHSIENRLPPEDDEVGEGGQTRILKRAVAYLILALVISVLAMSVSTRWSNKQALPETTEEVMSRLVKLETRLAQLSSTSREFAREYEAYVKKDGQKFKSLENEVTQKLMAQAGRYEDVKEQAEKVKYLATAAVAELETIISDVERRCAETGQKLEELGRQVESAESHAESRFSEFEEQIKKAYDVFLDAQTALKGFTPRLTAQDAEVARLDGAVRTLEARVERTLGQVVSAAETAAAKAIEEILPERIAVRIGEGGEVAVKPEFWGYLSAAFSSREEMERVRGEVESARESLRELPSVAAGDEESYLSWEEFLAKNSDAVRTMSRAQFTEEYEKLVSAQTVLTRDTFMDLVRAELGSARDEFSRRVNEAEYAIEKKIMDAARGYFSGPKKEDLGWLARLRKSRAGQKEQRFFQGEEEGDNLTMAAIETMVGEAIERFEIRQREKVDFADVQRGARVIRAMTGALQRGGGGGGEGEGFVEFMARMVLGRPSRFATGMSWREQSALTRMESSGSSCWWFAGQEGWLGIRLGEWIYVDEVGLSHVPGELAGGAKGAAPKEFEVWVEIEGEEERRAVREAVECRASSAVRISSDDSTDEEEEEEEGAESEFEKLVQPGGAGANYVKLGKFRYDVRSPFHLQQFGIPRAAQKVLRRTPVRNFVFRFVQNWGGEGTCVYKALVYGKVVGEGEEVEEERGVGDDVPV
ncbi:hypothetical protein BZA70DRAFT_99194 [Myxozyma melibiosi]|uniref:SUN domain-containing protein n=1 Tax=Myxozyma melibiosi TaxID=54550 RepID=A0ABR1F0F4_9ASCO